MKLDRQICEERILNNYAVSYDIEKMDSKENHCIYTGDFHVHSENYVMVRSAQLFAMDTFDHLFVYSFDNLTAMDVKALAEDAYQKGFKKIKPNKIHRSSYITALIYCDTCDAEAIKAVKRFRRRKSFKFSLEGWMEVHVVCIEFGKDKIYHNGDGRNTGKFLKDVLHPKKRSTIHKLFSR